jgi:transcriptional regulator with XRE-family HTH domain
MPKRRPINKRFVTQVGARIRYLRLETGLSLRKLAAKAKCSADGLVQIELGRSPITSKMLLKLARGLNVKPFDLLNLDTHNDDLGYVVEKMRQDPETAMLVTGWLKSGAIGAGNLGADARAADSTHFVQMAI